MAPALISSIGSWPSQGLHADYWLDMSAVMETLSPFTKWLYIPRRDKTCKLSLHRVNSFIAFQSRCGKQTASCTGLLSTSHTASGPSSPQLVSHGKGSAGGGEEVRLVGNDLPLQMGEQ